MPEGCLVNATALLAVVQMLCALAVVANRGDDPDLQLALDLA